MTEGRFLDDPRFEPILARAEQLDVPIYLHPNLPPHSVRDAYYSGLPGFTGFRLSRAAWGWHSETAIHVLRLVVSGALDRHPKLKLIIGHMGEGLAAMLVRSDKSLTVGGSPPEAFRGQTILDQVWVTTSGLFTLPPLEVAARGLRRRSRLVLDRLSRTAATGWGRISSTTQAAGSRPGKVRARQRRRLLKLPASKQKDTPRGGRVI